MYIRFVIPLHLRLSHHKAIQTVSTACWGSALRQGAVSTVRPFESASAEGGSAAPRLLPGPKEKARPRAYSMSRKGKRDPRAVAFTVKCRITAVIETKQEPDQLLAYAWIFTIRSRVIAAQL
jgi:hypothetical protein